MKRLKIFTIVIISVLLIATIGRLAFAEEYGIELDVKDFLKDGTIYLDGTTFKKYTNVQCVQRGTSFKKGYFKITAVADIQGETVELTRYGKGNVGETEGWNYPTKSLNTTTIKDSPESNILAAILSSDDYSHGYYITEMDAETGKRADSQLAIWYYWNQWSNSLPTEGGLDWGNVFPYSVNNELKDSEEGAINEYYNDGKALVEQGVFEKYDETKHKEIGIENFKYIKSTEDGSYVIPENGVYDEDDDRYRKLYAGAREIATAHEYHAKIYLVQFYDYKSGEDTDENKERKAQNLIIYEPKEPIKRLTLEKIWDDSDNKYNVRPASINVQITAYARNAEKNTYEPTDVQVYKENDDGTLYTNEDGEYEFEKDIGRTYEVVLSEAKNWKEEIRVRSKDDTKELIYYAIKEIQVDGYELDDEATVGYRELNKNVGAIKIGRTDFIADDEIFGTNWSAYIELVNKLEGKVNIKAIKVWDDMDDLDGYRPTSITVTLKENGNLTDKKATLSESNNWTYTFEGLEKYKKDSTSGEWNQIDYEIVEDEIIVGNEKPYEATYEKIVTEATENEPEIITYKIKNKHVPHYDGYYEIKGTVWLDGKPGKDSTINGTLGSEDIGIPDIKATLYYNGTQFDASSYAYTDNNGEYTIKVNYDNSSNVYKLYQSSSEVEKKISDGKAWVMFEYDGMVYTTVRCDTELKAENTSKAQENYEQRRFIDETYYKVNTATPEIEYYGKTIEGTDKTIPAINYNNNTYWNKTKMWASTMGIINSFTDYKFINTDNEGNPRKEKETIRYCNGDTNGDGVEEYISTNPTGAWNTIVEGKHDCTDCDAEGHGIREFEVDVITINGVNLGLMERERPDTTLDSTIHKVDVKIKEQDHTYIYNEMNPNVPNKLGKLYQDLEEAIYVRQINSANIVLANKNNQDIIDVYVTYSIGIGNQAETLTTVVNSVINDYDKRYEIDSIKVETLNDEGEINTELTRQIDLSSITYDNTITTHNRVKLDNLNIKAEANKASKQIILITYKVNSDAVLSLLNGDIVLNNATEIDSYETYYGEGTLYAEEQRATIENPLGTRINKPYAGYDIDSHPGNAGIQLIDGQLKSTDNLVTVVDPETGVGKEQPEDDTDIAPPFKLSSDAPYTVAGTVWEDKDIDIGTETEANTYRIGNGIKDEGENTLANVKVTLMEVLEDGTKQIAKLYHGQDGIHEEGLNAEVYTDKNGNYSFATPEGASAEFAGKYSIPAGYKYELKFTYGNEDLTNATTTALGGNTSIENNGARSARDYKSTIISNANTTLYNYFKDEVANVNDKWHLYTSDNYSIAIDDLGTEGRIKVDEDLYYGNFDEGKNISADSKPFIMTIEFTPDNESKVDADGQTITGTEQKLESELDIFDFGIIERAREDLVVSKTINYMDVKLVDGSTLASGDPSNKEELNFVKVQGLRENEISKSGEAALQQRSIRQAMLEMDSEITQGATVNLEYKIIVTNNSEKDIDYTKDGGNYYKFGEIPANPENYIMSSSVDCLVTYVNKDLNPQLDETVWQSQQVNTLRSEEETGMKLISQPTKEAVTENNYVVFTTTEFKDVKPGDEPKVLQSIIANKRLTFKEENAYDIHSEILVIDGKVARTIDSVEDGKQIPKTYKSGNLVPSLEKRIVQDTDGFVRLQGIDPILSKNLELAGLHEQDDDSVKVTITQPTGITKYITTYVIATLIGLVVIVIGIVFIKKKVLTK